MSSFDTKLNFLQQEIKILTEENKELRQLIQMNKEILKIYRGQTSTNTLPNGPLITLEVCKTESYEGTDTQNMLSHLIEENCKLFSFNEDLIKQRDDLRAQNLLLQQIGMENSQRILDIQSEKQIKLIDLQNQLLVKDNQIVELNEQLQGLLQKKRMRTKIPISIQNEYLSFQNQLEAMYKMLIKYYEENRIQKQENKKLQMIIDIVKNDKTEDNNKQLNEQSPQLNESSFVDFLPPQISTTQNHQIPIPKLNLGKAQKIQQLTVEKQLEQEEQQIQLDKVLQMDQKLFITSKSSTPQNKNGYYINPNKLLIQLTSFADQNKTLQKELNQCKTKLQDELLLNKALEIQLEDMNRYVSELESTNELLIKSQIALENNFQKLKQFIIQGKKEQQLIKHKYNVSLQNFSQIIQQTKKRCNSEY
ncbi:unnamed protein product (macronuclear) [Paramecium tetraurelia]|uniref:Uncharacterized protein n=1 Tax=Paramecium tetraurelia TaxID=5888 RepID=A0DQH3_PARTE|nr:uncharacterized protein GSPATT00002690001 [Paramecium tetraurelia]CAK85290.1 unnamed protein product [Paramecium tetraurelia]|eukprot:XP_001452687.1 hypothetical protein (macronuclear) [Paramecium tetraurelia strain d4-2]